MTAARLQVEVGYADKGADAGLKKLDRKVDQSSQKMGRDLKHGADKASTALKGLGVIAIGSAAALGGAFAIVNGNAAEFGKTMSGVQAVSNATGEEMKALSALALQLGKDTVFSATEAGQGIEELVKGGISIPDIMNGAAAAALNLASAGSIALPAAAEQMSDAMNIFGLKGTEAAHAADLIAGAANASSMTVSDFGLALKQTGAVAKLSGQDFDSTATAIAVMAQAGIKGSDAGTSLKTMFLNLQPTTKAAIGMFQELGILTEDGANKFVDAQGKFKSMADIAEVLKTATSRLTEAQKLQALETMFGTDAIRAAAIMSEAGSEGFAKMAAEMSKVTAEQVALQRLNNLAGDMEQLKGSFETTSIMLGSLFTPVLRDVTKGLTDMLNAGIESLGGLQAHIDALVADEGLSQWDATLLAVSAELARTFGPETALLFEGFTQRVADTTETMGNLFSLVSQHAPAWIETISSGLNLLGKGWDRYWDNLADGIIQQGLAFKKSIADFQALSAAVGEILGDIGRRIGGFFSSIGTWITSTFPEISARVQELGGVIVEGLKAALGPALTALGGWFGDRMKDLIQAAADAIRAHSPSEEAEEEIGVPIAEGIVVGLAEGLEEGTPVALKALNGFMESLVSSSGTFNVMFGKMGGDIASDLALAIANNTPQAGAAVGRSLQKMVEELGKAGVENWRELGDTLAEALHTAMVDGSEESILAVHALIAENVALIDAAKAATKAESEAAKEAERLARATEKVWKPGQGFFNAVTEVARGEDLVKQYGIVGANAAEAFGAAWDGDHNAEAKAGNAIQRMIGEAQRLGIQDANTMGGAIIDALGMALKTGDEALRDIGLEALAAFGKRTEEVKAQAEKTKAAIETMVDESLAKMRAGQSAEDAKIDADRARAKLESDFLRKQAEIRAKGGPNMGADLAAASAQFSQSQKDLEQRLREQTQDRERNARNAAALAAEKARLQAIGRASLAATTGASLPPGVSLQSIRTATAASATAGTPPEQATTAITREDIAAWMLSERPIELSLFLDSDQIEAVVTRRHANNNRSLALA